MIKLKGKVILTHSEQDYQDNLDCRWFRVDIIVDKDEPFLNKAMTIEKGHNFKLEDECEILIFRKGESPLQKLKEKVCSCPPCNSCYYSEHLMNKIKEFEGK